MLANTDGTDVHQVSTTIGEWGDFMPSDDQLVQTRTVDGHLVLSIISLDGSGTVRDLPLNGIQPNYWVEPRPPAGDELIFTGYPSSGSTDLALYGIKPDGTGLRTIGAVLPTDADDHNALRDPVVSPDGKTITFWNFEHTASDPTPRAYLHIRDLTTGAELPAVSTDPIPTVGFNPQFSPDGTMVAFTHYLTSDPQQWQLYVASVDGSQRARPIGLDFPNDDNGGFTFSPDGTQVIMSDWGATWLVDVATGKATALPGIPVMPSWQRLAP